MISACCPGHNEHIDIKKVANNHVTDILEYLDRCQKGQKFCRSVASSSPHFLFPCDFSGTIADTDIINTPLEPLRPTDVPFSGLQNQN